MRRRDRPNMKAEQIGTYDFAGQEPFVLQQVCQIGDLTLNWFDERSGGAITTR
jgi:hypothetical protein